jgi:DhnA family fructose-bisphosphate aldolase class Ia
MDGRQIRIQRLMGHGRAVVIAMDHGMFDGPIPAMEDLPQTARKINPLVDAVLLAPGMLRHCRSIFAGQKRPLAAVRLNWNSVYCFHWEYRQARGVHACDVEDAIREGMDVALVSLTLQTGSEERDAANVEVFSRLTTAAHRLGIPVIGEYFPTGHLQMTPKQLHENVRIGARIVAELGADVIKTFNTVDFALVTSTCPVPVLGLGAEKLPTPLDALKLAAAEVAAGAGGVVFGRNAIQVEDPHAFQAALCDVVKMGVSPQEAAERHHLKA